MTPTRALRTAISVIALAALAACRTPATEIVLRVETDMDQGPGHTLTDVRVTVTSQGEAQPHFDQTFQLGVGSGLRLLPADLGITPRNNDGTRTIAVDVHAISNGTELFTYRAIAPFESGHTNELLAFLADRCRLDANRVCLPDETCGRYGCESVNHSHLPAFVPDAGTDAGGIDAPGETGIDAQSELPSDIGVDTQPDVPTDAPPCGMGSQLCNGACISIMDRHNCGACAHDCTGLPNTVVASGDCDATGCLLTCAANFRNCDGNADNGCETDLTTDANCGACHATCTGSMHCTLAASGYGCASSCGALTPTLCGSSCVNTNTDPDHCGNCTTTCPPPPSNGAANCMMGTCSITCIPGYHACGTQCLSNTSPNSCGSLCSPCPVPANAIATCNGTSCGFTCLGGWGDCDTIASNGCEQPLSATNNCGACGTVCGASAPVCQPSGSSFACVSTCTSGGPCMPTSLCRNGTIACPGASCSPTTFYATGTACRGGVGVCDALGNCNACSAGVSCSTGNACTLGTTDCSFGMATCMFAGNVNAGSPCAGGVCNGAGACVPCASGTPCNTGNPCTLGAISCATGGPVCMPTGNASPSTPCGSGDASGLCDGNGSCSVCSGGVSCNTGNPCVLSVTTCPSGCMATGPAGFNTPCPGGYCNGTGTCTPCAPMMSCMVNQCTYGLTSCSGSGSTCQFSGYVVPGTSCTGGTCDASGNCVSCTPGLLCGFTGECWYTGLTSCAPLPVCTQLPKPLGTLCSLGQCNGSGGCVPLLGDSGI